MSFNTALSGLKAATTDLNVTSNNIANVSTTGFKRSNAEFGDFFEVTPFGTSSTAVGAGVEVTSINQQFGQGNLDFTDNALDLAISGAGFFIMDSQLAGGDISYTRAGSFRVDSNGYITNSQGEYLQTFPIDSTGTVTSTSINTLVPIQLQSTTGAPSATTEVEIGMNLDATEVRTDPTNFDPTVTNSFNHSTSTTLYDSLGSSHILTYYFVHDALGTATNAANDPNQWVAFPYLDGVEVNIPGGSSVVHNNNGVAVPAQGVAVLNFNSDGSYASNSPATLTTTVTAATLGNGAADLVFNHDFVNNSPTQFASAFSVSMFQQDGSTTGRLTGLDVSEEGLIQASFSNGSLEPLGQIAFASFPSEQGLQDVGNASWEETTASGAVLTGVPGTGSLGRVQSGALESSNVDLTSQLVNLIIAQRNFQANARSIETSNAITDTVIQIR
ncbi:MAG: flagellar hook protein FlgE [Gammaproteobacteria bacterium]|nr:flagellar hook protein FlgE [Gammaproteobacteria bacterium]